MHCCLCLYVFPQWYYSNVLPWTIPLIATSIIPTCTSTEMGPLSPSVTPSACMSVWLRPLWVRGQWQCCYGSCLSIYYSFCRNSPSVSVLPHPSVPMATTTTIPLTGTRPLTTVTFGKFASTHFKVVRITSCKLWFVQRSSPFIPTTTFYQSSSAVFTFLCPWSCTQVKLPKLSIRRFNGDLMKCVTFWDSFALQFTTRPCQLWTSSTIYLSSLVESSAAQAIAEVTLTAANYTMKH